MSFDIPSSEKVADQLIAKPGKTFKLKDIPTRDESLFEDKHAARASTEEDAREIDRLQDILYAEQKRALLVVLQGIDTAGKSGTMRAVFAYTSPLGLQVAAFKKPTDLELAHDYLWRVHQVVPRKGFIGIFDRSHYEDVLVVKVRGFAPKDDIERRYDQINQFEKHLTENGTEILKFMLHISPETQAERLKSRLDEPHKRWKFNPGDLEDRKLWPEFMDAYDDMVERCSTDHAPWYVVPSDSKSRRNAMIARIVRRKLEQMDPQYPDPGWKAEDYDL
ncbi:MAG: polyphosphate kinase [Ponticaulis sp.]|nr:polyphosphate kinase [Ponticaulis sp.]